MKKSVKFINIQALFLARRGSKTLFWLLSVYSSWSSADKRPLIFWLSYAGFVCIKFIEYIPTTLTVKETVFLTCWWYHRVAHLHWGLENQSSSYLCRWCFQYTPVKIWITIAQIEVRSDEIRIFPWLTDKGTSIIILTLILICVISDWLTICVTVTTCCVL